jgi:septal ring factor EnvC (AmiA/AmiB activator)
MSKIQQISDLQDRLEEVEKELAETREQLRRTAKALFLPTIENMSKEVQEHFH